MHPTLRSVTPRFVTDKPSSRKNSAAASSDGTVLINQEISIVSSRADDQRFEMYSTSLSNGGGTRARSDGEGFVVTQIRAPLPLNRWHSKTNTRNPLKYSRGSRRHGHQSQSTQDIALLEDNRQSMKELSEFLSTKEPPPSNFMSIPESADEKSLLEGKKSLFKHLFRRQKKKRNKKWPRLLRLPDTAVSSKTSAGHRHIAISIPLEYDHVSPPASPALDQILASEQQGIGEITILRPVTDASESGSFQHIGRRFDDYGKKRHPHTAFLPVVVKLEKESGNILWHSYANSNQSSPATGSYPRLSRLQKESVAQPLDSHYRNSQWSDLRHSGGTIYSEQTLETLTDHSGGPSNTSTPQTTPLSFNSQLDLPPRKLSARPSPKKIRTNSTTRRSLGYQPNNSALSGEPAVDSLHSMASFPPAAALDIHNFAVIDQSPPLGALPPLPRSKNRVASLKSRPKSAPMERFLEQQLISGSGKDGEINTIKKRQERVKARKQRDIIALRQNAGSNWPPLSQNLTGSNNRRVPSRSNSSLRRERRNGNRTTRVITVADIAPHPSTHQIRRSSKVPDINCAFSQITHTPPRSLTASSSEDEYAPRSRTQSLISKPPPSIIPPRPRPSSSHFLSHHNKAAREREAMLDSRLAKIERDNAMLLYTLNSISKSFSELNQVFPLTGQEKKEKNMKTSGVAVGNGVDLDGEVNWIVRSRGLEGMANLVRELRVSARVSHEMFRGAVGGEENDEDKCL